MNTIMITEDVNNVPRQGGTGTPSHVVPKGGSHEENDLGDEHLHGRICRSDDGRDRIRWNADALHIATGCRRSTNG